MATAVGTAAIASPLRANDEHDIQVSLTDAKVATLTVDGQKAFDVDYSAMTNLSNKLAIGAPAPGRSWTRVTDVYIKDFPEVVEAAKHAVSGKVVDAEGAAIEGATVRLDTTKVKTGADGHLLLRRHLKKANTRFRLPRKAMRTSPSR